MFYPGSGSKNFSSRVSSPGSYGLYKKKKKGEAEVKNTFFLLLTVSGIL
jgi:hypothetical protein